MAIGEIEFLCFVINRIEIRVGEQTLAFDRPHQNGAGAVFFRPANLIESVGHAERRRHARPTEPSFSLLPDIGEPAIPALAQRDFHRGAIGGGFDKHGVVQHLDIDAGLIHVLDAQIDVAQLARLLRIGKLAADLLRAFCQFLGGEKQESEILSPCRR